ncbi:hypothetical protein GGQ88_002534 [Novosphingobium hassiacum]|uniref:Class I SAM-dependent methyltransferase n=1 Tax=Novosphingobium hassiacum TaxID=173676 RepID=A0A7W5ZZN8_9SPHN|nr:class I SAM-dependent methyltransferase [Novosphingobium hassiacum]MBB3861262.1 hypothetical protein [Novosphingobium hassiacum]
MQIAKQVYSSSAQAIAALPMLDEFWHGAASADPAGLHRWFASLLAIHQPERMIPLDCPWWNVEATLEIDAFLKTRPDARVFEYGSGASTAWLARRAREVISVEHHAGWHQRLGQVISDRPNVRLWHRDLAGPGYVDAIAEAGGAFDLIVVDGRQRNICLERAIPFMKPGGVILFDDTGRRRYRSSIKTCGLRERRHFGRSYCVPYPDFTSILHA